MRFDFLPFRIESFSTSGTSPRCSPCQPFNVFICHKRLLATEGKTLYNVPQQVAPSAGAHTSFSKCSEAFTIIKSTVLTITPLPLGLTYLLLGTLLLMWWVWNIEFRYYQAACKECAAGLWRAGSKWHYFAAELVACHSKVPEPCSLIFRSYTTRASHQLHSKTHQRIHLPTKIMWQNKGC